MLAVVSRIACSSVLQKFISKLFKCILLWLIEVTIEMHEVIFVVRAGIVFGRYVYTPSRFSIHRGMKSPGRSVSWRAIANQRARLDSPFPSRPVTATPVFLRFRGEYEITLIEYRHNWALKTR